MKASEATKRNQVPRCECGGALRATVLQNFDFSNFVGMPVQLEAVPGLRCSKCGGETLTGKVINTILIVIALAAIRSPQRLSATLAKYLRRVLQITQQELADRMGIARETVAQWERGEREISPQHDLILRTILMQRQVSDAQIPQAVLLEAFSTLGSVKSDPPPRGQRKVQVSASEYERAKLTA